MPAPESVLELLATQLRDEHSVISAHVREPGAQRPALGRLAAAGPRAAAAPREYALVVESVREGYLLHYGSPRIVEGSDRDLALLAGDYLYALGLERLGRLGDLEAVRELSDLITLAAGVHDGDGDPAAAANALWLASVTAIAAGPSAEHQAAKAALRDRAPEAPDQLAAAARASAASAGLGDELGEAADAIDFVADLPS